MKIYKTAHEYFCTIITDHGIYRVVKCEQGLDNSFYVKWNLSLGKSKDGDFQCRSYMSYHAKFIKDKGYKVHLYGCGGNRIKESAEYRKKFITEYDTHFLSFSFDGNKQDFKIHKVDYRDKVFDLTNMDITNLTIQIYSDKRIDLIDKDANDGMSKILDLNNYNIVLVLYNKRS